MAAAGEEHGVKNHSAERLKVLVFVAPNPLRLSDSSGAVTVMAQQDHLLMSFFGIPGNVEITFRLTMTNQTILRVINRHDHP